MFNAPLACFSMKFNDLKDKFLDSGQVSRWNERLSYRDRQTKGWKSRQLSFSRNNKTPFYSNKLRLLLQALLELKTESEKLKTIKTFLS